VATAFAGAALAIAAIGLFALAAAGVARRRGEIGVRMALGATPRRVAGLVLREGMALVFAGVALGTLIALPSAGVLASFVHRVPARDPLSLLGAAATLLLVAALAVALPARRASRIDPLRSLRA
jgi:ABC-type antimicrobial peptide transport system permease subunit